MALVSPFWTSRTGPASAAAGSATTTIYRCSASRPTSTSSTNTWLFLFSSSFETRPYCPSLSSLFPHGFLIRLCLSCLVLQWCLFWQHTNGDGAAPASLLVSAVVASSICACQPSEWEFTLDFSRVDCGDTNVQVGMGVTWVSCGSIPSFYDNQFRKVESVEIREYDAQGHLIHNQYKQASLNGPFTNGQSFSYTSVLAWAPAADYNNHVQVLELPETLEVQIRGTNQLEESSEFQFYVYFSNDCKAFPVIQSGDYIGPVTVVRVVIWSYLLVVWECGNPVSTRLSLSVIGFNQSLSCCCCCFFFFLSVPIAILLGCYVRTDTSEGSSQFLLSLGGSRKKR